MKDSISSTPFWLPLGTERQKESRPLWNASSTAWSRVCPPLSEKESPAAIRLALAGKAACRIMKAPHRQKPGRARGRWPGHPARERSAHSPRDMAGDRPSSDHRRSLGNLVAEVRYIAKPTMDDAVFCYWRRAVNAPSDQRAGWAGECSLCLS